MSILKSCQMFSGLSGIFWTSLTRERSWLDQIIIAPDAVRGTW